MVRRLLQIKKGDVVKLWGSLCASLQLPPTKIIMIQEDKALELPTWAVKCKVNEQNIPLKDKR